MNPILSALVALSVLERRGVITTDACDEESCCGIERDDDGFCRYRPGHPVFVQVGS